MNGQHVGAAEQLILGHVGRAPLFGGFAGQVRAPCDHLHAEGRPDPRHPGADPAKAQHPRHRAAERATDRRLPNAGAHRQALVDDPPSRGENECPSELNRGLDGAYGRADIDTALLGGRDVDRGVERSGGRDHLEIRKTLDDGAGQRRAFPHDADHVIGRQPVDDCIRIGEVVVIHRDVGSGGNPRPVGHTHRDLLVVVEDRDLHHA